MFQTGAFQPTAFQVVGEAPVFVPEERRKDAGRPKRKRYREKFVVEIDGQDFVVQSAEEAEILLAEARQTVEEAVQEAPKAQQKIKAPRIRVRGTPGPDLSELVSIVKESREQIRAIYERARDAEIAMLLRMRAEQDEDDAITVLMLH